MTNPEITYLSALQSTDSISQENESYLYFSGNFNIDCQLVITFGTYATLQCSRKQ